MIDTGWKEGVIEGEVDQKEDTPICLKLLDWTKIGFNIEGVKDHLVKSINIKAVGGSAAFVEIEEYVEDEEGNFLMTMKEGGDSNAWNETEFLTRKIKLPVTKLNVTVGSKEGVY